jgi:hypothetical protein
MADCIAGAASRTAAAAASRTAAAAATSTRTSYEWQGVDHEFVRPSDGYGVDKKTK